MSSHTLLDYLTRPNPTLNDSQSLQGLPTFWPPEEPIEITEWADFSYETLMSCYGNILRAQNRDPFPGIAPIISNLERQIFDEDSLEHLLSRSITSAVSVGLEKAWHYCYPNYPDRGIDITRGGRARRPAISPGEGSRSSAGGSARHEENLEKTKTYPDWAGVQGTPGEYHNRCPGETKLATKWTTLDRRGQKMRHDSFYWPIAQVTHYCCKNWNTRYGYLITQDELVVMRFSREKIGSGLGAKRSPRETAAHPSGNRSHQRNVSSASGTSRMSIDRTSGHSRESSVSSGMASLSVADSTGPPSTGGVSYRDRNAGGELRPVEMKSIPWDNSGDNKLTVKLALWWIHMMAAAPGCDKSVRDLYPPLDSWVPVNDGYRHNSTGLFSKAKPKEDRIVPRQPSPPQSSHGQRSVGPSTPPKNRKTSPPFSSPLSSPPSSMKNSPSGKIRPSRLSDGSDESDGNKGKEPKR